MVTTGRESAKGQDDELEGIKNPPTTPRERRTADVGCITALRLAEAG